MKKIATLVLCGMSLLTTYANAQSDRFSGNYLSRTADTISQLALLPDQTFCYVFIGGNLDLMVAGQWKRINSNSISIIEHRQDIPAILLSPAKQEDEDDSTDTKSQIRFSGHSLANDLSMLFGFSRDSLRPILSPDHNGFKYWYKIDAADTTHSVFIGRINTNVAHKDGYAKYQVSEYAVDFSQTKVINVYLNSDASRQPINTLLTLKGNKLSQSESDGDSGFTRQKPLDSASVKQIKNDCIAPILSNQQTKEWAKPKQTFEIELPINNAKPYFTQDEN